MALVALKAGADVDGFRRAVRWLVANEVAPRDVSWSDTYSYGPDILQYGDEAPRVQLPADVVALAKLVICHRDPERYALLYDLIWRVRHGERYLLEIASDPLVHRLARMRKAIAREIHKMHAFLRFRRSPGDDGERFVAWFEPQHFILDEVAPFFVSRFPSFEWSILTPIGSLHWDRKQLSASGPASKPDLPVCVDEFEDGWVDYYRSTFNPARLNTRLMQAEMPKRYWRNMPEAQAIAGMVREASCRVDHMLDAPPTVSTKRKPERALDRIASAPSTLTALNDIISGSQAFVLGGTRAVLGEGPISPDLAFVGEQPGDQEDAEGRPFIGPAGQVFDRALAASGISRERCYVTNAVKHFKYEQRGKRRIHQKPTHGEIKHYRWWLEEEMRLVKPKLIVALGASAAFALTGRPAKVVQERGLTSFDQRPGLITIHPSFILRLQDAQKAEDEFGRFVADLTKAREASLQIN
jgi:uracil-DNA glycosylase